MITTVSGVGTVYEAGRLRIIELVSDLDDEAAHTLVPACPEWSIQDVVSHVTGICADIISGNIADAPSDRWTADQVEARRDRPLAEVIAEWSTVGPQIEGMLDDFPGFYGRQMVADVTAHEHDLRGTLDRPGERDSEGVTIGTDFLMKTVIHSGAISLGLGPLEVRADGHQWIVGTGDPATETPEAWRDVVATGELPDAATKPPVATLDADRFELFRAIAGRRSAAQIRAFEWSVDPEPYVPMFASGPFTVRPTDLDE